MAAAGRKRRRADEEEKAEVPHEAVANSAPTEPGSAERSVAEEGAVRKRRRAEDGKRAVVRSTSTATQRVAALSPSSATVRHAGGVAVLFTGIDKPKLANLKKVRGQVFHFS